MSKKNNIDELLASSAPITPRKITFHKAQHAESLNSFRSKYTPINSSMNASATPTKGKGASPAKGGKASNQSPELEEATLPVPKKNLYPKEKIFEILQWSKPNKIGAGLHNVGNTCFLNSTLQCLTYCPPLANYFNARHHSKSCRKVGFCAMCAMERHVVAALKATAGAIVPKEIVSHLRAIVKHFRLGRQEDAHEFLCYLLSGMHKNCLPSGEKLDARVEQTSVVHRIFGGHLQSSVVCAACSYASNTFDPFLDLSLEVKHCSSVNDALIHFTKPEVLDSSNMYKCEKCSKRSRAKKQLSIHEAPNVLVVQLKRFSYRSMLGGKISKFISYPSKLSLKPFMSKNQHDTNPSYDLYGVLVHSGYDTRAGHYYCYIKNSNGIWHEMNDSTRRQVSQEQVMKQQAYLLFYVRSPDSLPSQSDGGQKEGKAAQKKRKREAEVEAAAAAADKHDSEEDHDDGGETPRSAQSSPARTGAQGAKAKAGPSAQGEDLGEAVSRTELLKRTPNGKAATAGSTPPQNKKRRVSTGDAAATNTTSPSDGKQAATPRKDQTKALGGFLAFNQMKSIVDKKDEEKQPQPSAVSANGNKEAGGQSSPVANGHAERQPKQQEQKQKAASAASHHGKAKEATRDDVMEEEEGDDGVDFSNMSIDDLFARFDDEEAAENGGNDKNKKNKNRNKKNKAKQQEPAASVATAKTQPASLKEVDVVPEAEKADEAAKPQPAGSQASQESPAAAPAVEATAAETGKTGKKKRRRRRNKNARADAANGGATAAAAASTAAVVAPPKENGHAHANGVSENGVQKEAQKTVAAGQKRKREEPTKGDAEETKKLKSDDSNDNSADGQDGNGKGNDKAGKAVVGSGKKDNVLTFDDLVFRRGGKDAQPAPMGKAKKSDGAKEWEQYLKQNTKEEPQKANHWDVKGIEGKVATQKHILQTAPELQVEKRQRDEWDVEYDKGRVKKVKKKPEGPASNANPFQNLQNIQRERKEAEKQGIPWTGGSGGRGGRGRGRGGRGPMGGRRGGKRGGGRT